MSGGVGPCMGGRFGWEKGSFGLALGTVSCTSGLGILYRGRSVAAEVISLKSCLCRRNEGDLQTEFLRHCPKLRVLTVTGQIAEIC